MPGPAITFRTDDLSRWGAGIGRNLTPAEFDVNFFAVQQALAALEADRPEPNNIASISVSGSSMIVTLTDGTMIGPLALPVLQFRWRAGWLPFTIYKAVDVFYVDGVGLFSVMVDHTSAGTFVASAVDSDGNQLYNLLFAVQTFVYDLSIYYAGVIRAVPSDVTYLYQEPACRPFTLPVDPGSGAQHQAYLQEPPSTSAQRFNLYLDDAVIGNVFFALGENEGVVTVTADTDFSLGERLALGKATTVDATAEGLSVVLVLRQQGA